MLYTYFWIATSMKSAIWSTYADQMQIFVPFISKTKLIVVKTTISFLLSAEVYSIL